MRFYSHRLIIALVAFVVGVCSVWLWLTEPSKLNFEDVPPVETSLITPVIEINSPQIKFEKNKKIKLKPEQTEPVSIRKLRPSKSFWGKSFPEIPMKVLRLSKNRKLVSVGDSLYMLNSKNLILWTWTTGGAPLTDHPIIDSNGIIYVIAFDITWVALDSKNGETLWSSTAVGRRVYSQIELYKNDMYLVVVDMSGYREHDYPGEETNDDLILCKGNNILWDTEIPANAKIRVREGKVFITYIQKKKRIFKELNIPQTLSEPIGKVDPRVK